MYINSTSKAVQLFNLIVYCLCKENKNNNEAFSNTLKSGEIKAINNTINIGIPLGIVTLYLCINNNGYLTVRSTTLHNDFFKVYLSGLDSLLLEENEGFYLYGLTENDIKKITGYTSDNDEKQYDNIGEQIEKIIDSLKVKL